MHTETFSKINSINSIIFSLLKFEGNKYEVNIKYNQNKLPVSIQFSGAFLNENITFEELIVTARNKNHNCLILPYHLTAGKVSYVLKIK